ncbi:leucine-rich repeat protein [Marixanthomonas spongiae]|uniref:Receptor L domain-containing protein n=1 Tax=Marixanthomonas spongiae TaxID=2174845 RepID=A0A2U0I239_9FLAO|nr:leucine-rich repeat protein [Marixanthomonas spongiae]PVW15134.1 hypothetical protein DDV96_06920 [Marixanthomonas spongiae]
MKKTLLFSLLLLLVIACNKDDDPTNATNNYVGDVTLRTQKEVEDFGKMGYTSVEGTICIGCIDQNDIDDLSSLSTLKKVNTLNIQNNTVLTSLDGLGNLTDIDNLLISKNPILENLNSFSGVTAINTIELDDNESLRNIEGLYNLTAIREHVKFINTRVVNLNFENVTVLGGFESTDSRFETITIGATKVGSFTLNNCYSLTQLNIANIEEIDHLYLIENNKLSNLNLENLKKINGTFSFVRNVALRSLKADNLTSLKTLHIENTQLTSINFENIQTPSEPISITIIDNRLDLDVNLKSITKAGKIIVEKLSSINLDGLTTVEDKFSFSSTAIASIALKNLTQLNGNITIFGNRSLREIEVNNLTIAGNLEIKDNPLLEKIEANSLIKAEDLEITHNDQLTTLGLPILSDLKSLTLRGSRVSVLNLENLQDRAEPTSFFINGNNSLAEVYFGNMTRAKHVRFENNSSLTDLPINNISIIEGSLYVVSCDNISDINIENISEVFDIHLFNNNNLETFIADNITQIGVLDIDASSALSTISMKNLGLVTERLRISGFGFRSDLVNLDWLSSLYSVEELIIYGNVELRDFCGITNLISNGYVGTYDVSNNGYNPTQQDIIDGNCSI